MEPVVLKGLDVVVQRSDLERFLGKSAPRDSISRRRLDEAAAQALETARALIEPKGIYIVTSGKAIGGSGVFDRLDRVALCVCTIGDGLEKMVAELQGRGELLQAFVLDAVGSIAAEGTANVMEYFLAEEAALRGLAISCRASPGYGDWDVSEQRRVFELVPADRIGVVLSSGCMMIPRKSVSFAVHMAREPERLRSENSCSACKRRDCPYRKAAEAE